MQNKCPDENLLKLIEAADPTNAASMADLFEATYARLYYYSYLITGNTDTAQDLLHDAFIKCMLSIDTLHDPKKFYPWMWRILKNTYSNMVRRDKAALLREESISLIDSVIEDHTDPEQIAEMEDLRCIIQCIIHNLPEEQREAILLRYYEELPVSEIAAIQNCPESTVKSRLLYAKRSIKAAIEAEEKRSGTPLGGVVCIPVMPVIMSQFASCAVLLPSCAVSVFASIAEFFGFAMASDTLRLVGTVTNEKSPIMNKTAVIRVRIFPAAALLVGCIAAVCVIYGIRI